jgi:transposase
VERICILCQVQDRKLTQQEAADKLNLSVRQVRRLLKRFSKSGAEGIKSCKRGGNRAFSQERKQKIIDIVKAKYHDFGPTFAAEKLKEVENLQINKETLRQWMVEAGLWNGRSRKRARIIKLAKGALALGNSCRLTVLPTIGSKVGERSVVFWFLSMTRQAKL